MPGVFISYRREDTGGAAGRLYDRLRAHFGSDRVFRDVDTIAPGDRFDRAIDERLARADVVVALIGRDWITSANADGVPRLHAPDDFVRLEIVTALNRGIPVIPALFGNARMPRADELPPELAPLVRHQAIEIDDPDFHDDVSRLIALLEPKVRPGLPRARTGWSRRALAMAGGTLAASLLLLAAYVVATGRLATTSASNAGSSAGGSAASAAASPTPGPGETAPRQAGANPIALRSATAVLASADVRAFIIRHGFFSAASNPAGAGIAHDYRQEVREGWPVVADRATDLLWDHGGSGRIVQGGRDGAEAYVRELNAKRAGGTGDWRLPTLEEAFSLMTAEAHEELHVDPVFARGAPFIWTADDDPDGRGWVVYYFDGAAAPERLAFNAYVRAVRTGR
jgi:hypothetical protein